MARPHTRDCTLRESLGHMACAVAVLVTVYVLGSFVADGAIAATRYWSG